MPIIVNLDVMMAKRKIRSKELAQAINITEQNLSILKTSKARAVRFSTLEAICEYLNCQPGDLLEFKSQDQIDEEILTASKKQSQQILAESTQENSK